MRSGKFTPCTQTGFRPCVLLLTRITNAAAERWLSPPVLRGRRYTHGREYLEAVCRATGFRVLVANEVVLRKNAGVPVRGFIFITEAA